MNRTNRVLLKGNEAAVYGALLAGCECYFGYPITPASESPMLPPVSSPPWAEFSSRPNAKSRPSTW